MTRSHPEAVDDLTRIETVIRELTQRCRGMVAALDARPPVGVVIRRSHVHPNGDTVEIDIDTRGEITPRAEVAQAIREWRMIREEAVFTFRSGRVTDTGRAYTAVVASGGRVHTVDSIGALANVTRRERQRVGVRWPEDPRGSA